jgi:hypothetical protein
MRLCGNLQSFFVQRYAFPRNKHARSPLQADEMSISFSTSCCHAVHKRAVLHRHLPSERRGVGIARWLQVNSLPRGEVEAQSSFKSQPSERAPILANQDLVYSTAVCRRQRGKTPIHKSRAGFSHKLVAWTTILSGDPNRTTSRQVEIAIISPKDKLCHIETDPIVVDLQLPRMPRIISSPFREILR